MLNHRKFWRFALPVMSRSFEVLEPCSSPFLGPVQRSPMKNQDPAIHRGSYPNRILTHFCKDTMNEFHRMQSDTQPTLEDLLAIEDILQHFLRFYKAFELYVQEDQVGRLQCYPSSIFCSLLLRQGYVGLHRQLARFYDF